MYQLEYSKKGEVRHACCSRDELLQVLLYLYHAFSNRALAREDSVLPTARTLAVGILA